MKGSCSDREKKIDEDELANQKWSRGMVAGQHP